MKGTDRNNEKKSQKMEFRKVIVNIPKPLLDEFDMVTESLSYSRSEAIKDAMRQFIMDLAPEGYISPGMMQYVTDVAKQSGIGFVQGMAQGANAVALQQQQLQQTQRNLSQQSQSLEKKKPSFVPKKRDK